MGTNGSSPEYDRWKSQGWICAGDAVKELSSLQRGVSRQTLHNWRKAGKVEAQHILEGKREYYLFRREDLGLPPAENMPEEALNTLRQMDIEFGARAEIASETLLEKLNPFLQGYTRELIECGETTRDHIDDHHTELLEVLSRMADSQERIIEILERRKEERRPWWKRMFD